MKSDFKDDKRVPGKIEDLRKVFKTGHDICAELALEGQKNRFLWRLIEVGENFLLVKAADEPGMHLHIPLGARVQVSTVIEGVLYGLETRVVSEEGLPFIKLAPEELLSTVQRRTHIRVDSFLPFRYWVLNEEEFARRKKFLMERPSVSDSAYTGFAWTRGTRDNEIVNDPLGRLLLEINFKLDRLLFAMGGRNPDGFSEGQAEELNISGSGLCFNTETELSPGMLLEVEFALPLLPPAHIHALGSVVRAERRGDDTCGPRWSIAVNFVAVSEGDREEIIRYTFIKQRQQLRNSL